MWLATCTWSYCPFRPYGLCKFPFGERSLYQPSFLLGWCERIHSYFSSGLTDNPVVHVLPVLLALCTVFSRTTVQTTPGLWFLRGLLRKLYHHTIVSWLTFDLALSRWRQASSSAACPPPPLFSVKSTLAYHYPSRQRAKISGLGTPSQREGCPKGLTGRSPARRLASKAFQEELWLAFELLSMASEGLKVATRGWCRALIPMME